MVQYSTVPRLWGKPLLTCITKGLLMIKKLYLTRRRRLRLASVFLLLIVLIGTHCVIGKSFVMNKGSLFLCTMGRKVMFKLKLCQLMLLSLIPHPPRQIHVPKYLARLLMTPNNNNSPASQLGGRLSELSHQLMTLPKHASYGACFCHQIALLNRKHTGLYHYYYKIFMRSALHQLLL